MDRSLQLEEILCGNETVLLVEDEDIVRETTTRSLLRSGYRVLVAANGDEALRQVDQHQGTIHLLLTDVVMPGMNGRQLAQRLAALYPEIRTLYTSGYTENAIAHGGIIEEGLSFIGKPYTPQALGQKIREVLA
jgi:CheY-like chemotaxis protein